MKKILEFFLCVLYALTFTPIYAMTVTQDCERHADEVIAITAAEMTNLDDRQYILLRNTVMESCLKNIIESNNNTIENAGDKDWFTEKILSGETDRKEGNKRLKKLK